MRPATPITLWEGGVNTYALMRKRPIGDPAIAQSRRGDAVVSLLKSDLMDYSYWFLQRRLIAWRRCGVRSKYGGSRGKEFTGLAPRSSPVARCVRVHCDAGRLHTQPGRRCTRRLMERPPVGDARCCIGSWLKVELAHARRGTGSCLSAIGCKRSYSSSSSRPPLPDDLITAPFSGVACGFESHPPRSSVSRRSCTTLKYVLLNTREMMEDVNSSLSRYWDLGGLWWS